MSLGLSDCCESDSYQNNKKQREEKLVGKAYLASRLLGRILTGIDSEFSEQFYKFDETRAKKVMTRASVKSKANSLEGAP